MAKIVNTPNTNPVEITLADGTVETIPSYFTAITPAPKFLIFKATSGDGIAAAGLVAFAINSLPEGAVKDALSTASGEDFDALFTQWTEGVEAGK